MSEVKIVPGVFTRRDPLNTAHPVVFDSPHSGNQYPADFEFDVPLEMLRMTEDAHVDELYGAAPEHGATLLHAHFPRALIDLNRHPLDLDAELLDAPWPDALQPSRKSEVGMGLIRRVAKDGVPMYRRPLSVAEVRQRIEQYYNPYHDELSSIIEGMHRRFGVVWHINCHSMRSALGRNPRPPTWKPNFIVSNRDGDTSDEPFLKFIGDFFRARGHTVLVNRPFKGGEIVRRHGDPGNNRHSVQIEINRKIYMDEVTLEKHEGFPVLQEQLNQLICEICEYSTRAL